ncbi:hypothetical protein APR41_02910 [Salegentibacter salinarum]|uniref:DUF2306 domain-containing protein n=1 Tax=Salegentibacter salinarum TaxID=447422 RepID=A0A2N0TXU4_9FLAO|nr:DUF2306 domain-containing protein [Salegentibacter salinarum]PKD19572.1 hypothetical protein APR41_02910 [Salegentibacter salinarum]SKB42005.1 Predicted membrane protein [Salegentibacter salinarum]
MPHDIIGWIHTIAAIIALITGSMILAKAKGTFQHKITGRIYGVSMLIVCITAFMIYRVHHTFGVLHVFAVVSTITLVLGMLPMYLKVYKKPRIVHLSWMYWSVIGLYCAFAAEIFTRLPLIFDLPNTYGFFYMLVGLSAGAVGMIGSYFFKRKQKVWETRFGT